MKEYGQLLAGEPGWAERAAAFAARVRDLSEWLAGRPGLPAGTLRGRVAYQDACHLAHVQGIRRQPRALLAGLAGCELIETEGADVCCGAAGLYGVVQPRMSAELRRRKAAAFAAAAPDTIVTANPGCHLQYLGAVREAGLRAEVLHLAEALDRAWREA
jgi:glycolate oxidase iron-sulfur subunit